MAYNRSGEQGSAPARNDRIFRESDYWYYTTREGVDIGPFDNRCDAEIGAGEFTDFIVKAGPSMSAVLQQYGNCAA